MKSAYRNLLLLLMICSVPLSTAFGQDKKTEKKIKVVIDNGSGPKTVIDTTFTNGSVPDSIILKNGNVIFLTEACKEDETDIYRGKAKKVIVTVDSDDNGEKNKEETIIIRSDGKHNITKAVSNNGEKHAYVYSTTQSSDGKHKNHVIIASAGDNDHKMDGKKIIIISDGKVTENGENMEPDIEVNNSDFDSTAEAAQYVIVKDGIVVTVKGGDEAKTKELVKEIKNKLGIKSEGDENKEGEKSENNKTIKK